MAHHFDSSAAAKRSDEISITVVFNSVCHQYPQRLSEYVAEKNKDSDFSPPPPKKKREIRKKKKSERDLCQSALPLVIPLSVAEFLCQAKQIKSHQIDILFQSLLCWFGGLFVCTKSDLEATMKRHSQGIQLQSNSALLK